MNKSDPRYPAYLEYQRAYQRERRHVDLEFRLRRNFDVYKCRNKGGRRMRTCELCGYETLWRNCPKCSAKTIKIDPVVRKAQKEKERREDEKARKARQKIAIESMLKRARELAKCSKLKRHVTAKVINLTPRKHAVLPLESSMTQWLREIAPRF